MYLSVSNHAVSAVLVGIEIGSQKPVYYVSKTLLKAEVRYLPLEKIALALVHATRRLPHYFQAHTIIVLIEYPLQALLRRADFSGRIAKWGTALGAYDIKYQPRTSIKGQVLANFVVGFTPKSMGKNLGLNQFCGVVLDSTPLWEIYVDRASNYRGSRLGVVLLSPKGALLEWLIRLEFSASNNEAEYEALLSELRMVKKVGAAKVKVFCDYRLVTNQVNGEFEVWDERMVKYWTEVKALQNQFEQFSLV